MPVTLNFDELNNELLATSTINNKGVEVDCSIGHSAVNENQTVETFIAASGLYRKVKYTFSKMSVTVNWTSRYHDNLPRRKHKNDSDNGKEGRCVGRCVEGGCVTGLRLHTLIICVFILAPL